MPTEREPSLREKKHQLEVILASKTFRRALKPAKLLRMIVEFDLERRPVDELILGTEVFGRPADWVPLNDSIVRENLSNARKRLKRYYLEEGRDDALRIELSAYQPRFFRSSSSVREQCYRRAIPFLRNNPSKAISLLQSALAEQPDNSETLTALAEALIWRLLDGYYRNAVADLTRAQELATSVLAIDRSDWRANIVMGAIMSCHREWAKAREAFNLAMISAPSETSEHPWYPAFLMAIGCREQALKIVEDVAYRNLGESWLQLTYALFQYVDRDFAGADATLRSILPLDHGLWLYQVLWNCLSVALGCSPSATKASRPYFENQSAAFINTEFLSKATLPASVSEKEDLRIGILFSSELWDEDHKDIALRNYEPVVREPKFSESSHFDVSPCQQALQHIIRGDLARAVSLLEQDFDRHHPLLAWLHLWPVFDPLRDDNDAKIQMARMNMNLPFSPA